MKRAGPKPRKKLGSSEPIRAGRVRTDVVNRLTRFACALFVSGLVACQSPSAVIAEAADAGTEASPSPVPELRTESNHHVWAIHDEPSLVLNVRWTSGVAALQMSWWWDDGVIGGGAYLVSEPVTIEARLFPRHVKSLRGTHSFLVWGDALEAGLLQVERWTLTMPEVRADGLVPPQTAEVEVLARVRADSFAGGLVFYDLTREPVQLGPGPPRTLLLQLDESPAVYALDLVARGDRQPDALKRLADVSEAPFVLPEWVDFNGFQRVGCCQRFGQFAYLRGGRDLPGVIVVMDADRDGVPDSVVDVPLGVMTSLGLINDDGAVTGCDVDYDLLY